MAFAAAWLWSDYEQNRRFGRVITTSWGDGKYGPAFYGAHVYMEPKADGTFSVRARVYIGPGNAMFHDCGELGTAATREEAIKKWSKVAWSPDGLRIGDGTNHYFLPRARLEAHR